MSVERGPFSVNHPCCIMNTSFISIKAKEEEDIERKNGGLWFAGTTNSCGFTCQNCMKVLLITMLGWGGGGGGGGGEQLEMRMVHALYLKSNLCIPEKGLARPKS